MSRAAQGSSRKRSGSRLIGLSLALFMLAFGSLATASEPVDAPNTEVHLTQGQPADTPVVDDTTSDDEAIEMSTERDNNDLVQAQTELSSPFGRTATIAYNRRR